MKSYRCFLVGLVACLCLQASAQWTFVSLHPDSVESSCAQHIDSDLTIVGYVDNADTRYGAMWTGTTRECLYLNPVVSMSAEVTSSANRHQIGLIYAMGWLEHAALWEGNAESFVDLHPDGAFCSNISDTNGTTHVGAVNFDGLAFHACAWTPEGLRDITPDGASEAWAIGIYQQSIVGTAVFGERFHAMLWQGDQAIDLNPSGCRESIVQGATADCQIGWTGNFYSGDQRAVIWHGSPESFVDLQPPNHQTSWAVAGSGNLQVGQVDNRAALWNGSAATYVDLQCFLPSEYGMGSASGIYRQPNGTCYIVGTSQNRNGYPEAWLLVGRPVFPSPTKSPRVAPPSSRISAVPAVGARQE